MKLLKTTQMINAYQKYLYLPKSRKIYIGFNIALIILIINKSSMRKETTEKFHLTITNEMNQKNECHNHMER